MHTIQIKISQSTDGNIHTCTQHTQHTRQHTQHIQDTHIHAYTHNDKKKCTTNHSKPMPAYTHIHVYTHIYAYTHMHTHRHGQSHLRPACPHTPAGRAIHCSRSRRGRGSSRRSGGGPRPTQTLRERERDACRCLFMYNMRCDGTHATHTHGMREEHTLMHSCTRARTHAHEDIHVHAPAPVMDILVPPPTQKPLTGSVPLTSSARTHTHTHTHTHAHTYTHTRAQTEHT